MMQTLRGVADTQIASFKADMQQVLNTQPLDQAVSTQNPLAKRLIDQLEVLHQWSNMFQRLIERFESRQFSNFDTIIRSEALASVFVALIALTANQNSARH